MRFATICTYHDAVLVCTGAKEYGYNGPTVTPCGAGVSMGDHRPVLWQIDLEEMVCAPDLEMGGDNACERDWKVVVVPE